MRNTIGFLAALLLPISLHGQFSSASTALLQSGVVHGTEREQHLSMRIQALGTDFSGYIDDEITDLYRNPAFFHRLQHAVVFGELVRQRRSSPSLPVLDTRAMVFSSSFPLMRGGQKGSIGFLVSGNYASTPSQTANVSESANSYSSDLASREELGGWGEVQASWGFSLFDKFSAGMNYTYGRNEGRRNLESSEIDYMRTTFSSGNTLIMESQNALRDNLDHADASHILRFGILREGSNGKSWDAVTTIERFSAKPVQDLFSQSNDRESRSSPYLFEEDAARQDYSRTGDLQSTNWRLDFRYRRSPNATRSFVAQLGVGVSWFSSHDGERSSSYLQSYRATAFDSAETSYYSRNTLDATPDGFGFQVQGGAGWNIQQNNFLFALAALASYQDLSYQDEARGESRSGLMPSETFPLFLYSIPYDFVSSQYRLALPLGVEYRTMQKLSLRAGWVPVFRGETYEERSKRIGEADSREYDRRISSHRLDVSAVTFGMGYRVFNQLRADLLNFGNLSQIQDWSLSVIYNF